MIYDFIADLSYTIKAVKKQMDWNDEDLEQKTGIRADKIKKYEQKAIYPYDREFDIDFILKTILQILKAALSSAEEAR